MKIYLKEYVCIINWLKNVQKKIIRFSINNKIYKKLILKISVK